MKNLISILAITTVGLAVAACGHTTTQRAATGAIAGAVVAGPVGAAVGAGTGAVVSKAAGDH
jgi:osmotically inducible lipoprotein OsmB